LAKEYDYLYLLWIKDQQSIPGFIDVLTSRSLLESKFMSLQVLILSDFQSHWNSRWPGAPKMQVNKFQNAWWECLM